VHDTLDQMAVNEPVSGADPGFQVRGGAHFKKSRRAEGGAKLFGVFRVKNHDYMPNNHIFSNFVGGGGARRVRPLPPPMDPPLGLSSPIHYIDLSFASVHIIFWQ
jgi:hypothetical protein